MRGIAERRRIVDFFLPRDKYVVHQRRVYKWLVKFHNGKDVKLESLRKACEQNDITQPSDSTMASARAGIEIFDKKLEDLRSLAYAKQRKHLTERLKHHHEQENKKAQRNIEQMMNREESD